MTVSALHTNRPSTGGEPRVVARVFALTDVGQKREHNEDAFLVADLEAGASVDFERTPRAMEANAHGLLFMVADGMGGAASGEIASGMATDAVLDVLRERWRDQSVPTADAFVGVGKTTADRGVRQVRVEEGTHPLARSGLQRIRRALQRIGAGVSVAAGKQRSHRAVAGEHAQRGNCAHHGREPGGQGFDERETAAFTMTAQHEQVSGAHQRLDVLVGHPAQQVHALAQLEQFLVAAGWDGV